MFLTLCPLEQIPKQAQVDAKATLEWQQNQRIKVQSAKIESLQAERDALQVLLGFRVLVKSPLSVNILNQIQHEYICFACVSLRWAS